MQRHRNRIQKILPAFLVVILIFSAAALIALLLDAENSDDPSSGDASDSISSPNESLSPFESEGNEVKRGRLTSNSGTHLNLYADYTAVRSDDGKSYRITVEVGITCYSIYVGARPNGGALTVGGVRHTFSSPHIEHAEDTKMTYRFDTLTFTVPIIEGIPFSCAITAEWPFNGTYSGISVGTLTLSGIIE